MIASLLALALASAVVDAKDHDAFWLWAGVRPQPVLAQAKTLYLLQGEVVARPVAELVAQRPAVPRVADADVWMVVRVQTIAWPENLYGQILAQLARWRNAGNHVVGVQIDFDAGTRSLERYASFLAEVRRRVPEDCKLGVTGLLDWSANGDPAGLHALAGTVDEVVLQIYQGRRVIPGYERYLARLDRLRVPFKIGVLQGGEWTPPVRLNSNPNYRGTVVFLVNTSPA